jgi:hypothetical protein
MGWLGDLRTTTHNKATGMWTSAKARGEAEYDLWKNEFNADYRKGVADKLSEIDGHIEGNKSIPGMEENIKALELNRPDTFNAGVKSFLSIGAGKAALAGAVVGGAYGVASDDISIAKGAMYGGGAGYISKGLFGMAGERRTLAGLSNKTMDNIYNTNQAAKSLDEL